MKLSETHHKLKTINKTNSVIALHEKQYKDSSKPQQL